MPRARSRGAARFAVHTWIVVKPSDAPRYTRYEVIGFGVANGAPAVRVDRTGPDNYWFGARPRDHPRPPRRGRRCAHRQGARGGRGLSLPARLPRLARPQQQHLHRLCRARGAGARPGAALQCDRQGLSAGGRGVRRGAVGHGLSALALRRRRAARRARPRGSSSTCSASISASTSPRPDFELPGIGTLGFSRLQPG